MTKDEMKIISEHLIDALNKESLPRREAARYLNFHPCYISMAMNPKSWDSMGSTAWYRLTNWHNSRGKISEFKFPDDEPIWKPKEKPAEDKLPQKSEIKKQKPPEFPADRIESHKDPGKKVKSPQMGIRKELITELQIRQNQLQEELDDIGKLINQYV